MTNEADANPFAYHETVEDHRAAAVDELPKLGWPEWIAAALLGMAAPCQFLLGLIVMGPGSNAWVGTTVLIGIVVPWTFAKRISVGKWPWGLAAYAACCCGGIALMGAPLAPLIATTTAGVCYSFVLYRRRIKWLDFWL